MQQTLYWVVILALSAHTTAINIISAVCHEAFVGRHLLVKHIMSKLKARKPHACLFCRRTYASLSGLKVHLLLHDWETSDQSMRTRQLRSVFSGSSNQSKHQPGSASRGSSDQSKQQPQSVSGISSDQIKRQPRPKIPFTCSVCGEQFATGKLLAASRHSYTLMDNQLTYTCDKCGLACAKFHIPRRHQTKYRTPQYKQQAADSATITAATSDQQFTTLGVYVRHNMSDEHVRLQCKSQHVW